jgi:hypothetical protein
VIFVVVFQPRRRCIDAADTIGQRHRIDAAAANATQKTVAVRPRGKFNKKTYVATMRGDNWVGQKLLLFRGR